MNSNTINIENQTFENFLLTCQLIRLDVNERHKYNMMKENCAYYYGGYTQFFYNNELYVTRTTAFSEELLKKAGYTLISNSQVNEAVPMHNFSVMGTDYYIIKSYMDEYIMKCIRQNMYNFTLMVFDGNQINLEETRSKLVADPKFRESIRNVLLENDYLRKVIALNGDKIFNNERYSSLLSDVVSLDQETFQHYLAHNSSFLYFTEEQKKESEYLEFFDTSIMPTVDAIIESYSSPRKTK